MPGEGRPVAGSGDIQVAPGSALLVALPGVLVQLVELML